MAIFRGPEASSPEDLLDSKTLNDHIATLRSTSLDNLETVCKTICSPSFVRLLQVCLHDSASLLTTDTISLVAELSKSDYGRRAFHSLLPPLVAILKNPDNVLKTVHQVYRAIGNLCYENDAGRQIILENGGMPVLVDDLRIMLRRFASADAVPDRDVLVGTALGCLNNVSNDCDACQEALLQCGYLNVLGEILTDGSLSLCQHAAVEQLIMLGDTSMETRQEIAKLPVASSLLCLLKTADADDVIEDILDLLSTMLISDEATAELVGGDCVQSLVEVIENEAVSENAAVSAGNILVELTARESSLGGSDGECLVPKASQWLVSAKDKPSLLTISALIIGNLSRNEAACERNCEIKPNGEQSIPEILLHILVESTESYKFEEERPQPETDATLQLQYALLSALKNLCTPEHVRRKVYRFASSPLTVYLRSYNRDTPSRGISKQEVPVVAKLLTLLRMYVSTPLGLNPTSFGPPFDDSELIKLAFKCGATSGLVEESLRLLCAMVRNSESSSGLVEKLAHGGLVPFVNRLLTSDLQSKIGAIVFLSLILEDFSKTPQEKLPPSLVQEMCEPDFFKDLGETASIPSLSTDVRKMMLLLLHRLAVDQDLKARIKETDLSYLFESCRKDPSNTELCSLAEDLLRNLEYSNPTEFLR